MTNFVQISGELLHDTWRHKIEHLNWDRVIAIGPKSYPHEGEILLILDNGSRVVVVDHDSIDTLRHLLLGALALR